jgi:hypothetical protein
MPPFAGAGSPSFSPSRDEVGSDRALGRRFQPQLPLGHDALQELLPRVRALEICWGSVATETPDWAATPRRRMRTASITAVPTLSAEAESS